ncbi:MAG: hypothetical protein JNN13_16145 [Planctomycetes bacterium]|nr:hypothetical protein [Planctomycetota bacterium]
MLPSRRCSTYDPAEEPPPHDVLTTLFQDPVPAQAGDNFGGTTEVHPVGVAALAMLMALTLLLPRRWSALPVCLLLCFIPAGQRIVIATVDFTFIRLLFGVVWLRVLVRSEWRPIVWNHLDRAMVLWGGVTIVSGTLMAGTLTVFVNRTGTVLDTLMVFFFFRQLIRSHEDLLAVATQFLFCSFAVVVFFAIENRTHRNMFAMFGGVPAITDIRDGRLRCQGAFAHSILAGCFWACLIPLYWLRGWLRADWILPVFGTVTAIAIVGLCASSTPVMALAFGMVGLGAWFLRGALRWYRWLIVAWLCVLHFILMKMPVWHLLARVDVVGGSTGWHRYHLVDKFFVFFEEWFLLGTMRTGHWGPGLHDVTNQFVAEGVNGGLARLLVFCWIVYLAFAGISRSLRLPAAGRSYQLASWALGTAMFMHCMNFIAVTYFEQIVVQWNLLLAAVSSLTLVPGAAPVRQVAQLAPA